MNENLNKLFESISFRLNSIFSFSGLSILGSLVKFILLLIFGLPFLIVEILGIFCTLCSFFPVIGIIFNLTFCLICDLLASFLFYLIMIPHKV